MKQTEFNPGYPVTLKLRIDWSELDLFGHVNNVMFLKYIQAARVSYWERTILYQRYLDEKKGPMLASVTCDFRKPLFYPGDVIIKTGLAFVGNTSFGLNHQLFNDQNELVAESKDVMVYFNFITNTKMEVPEDIRTDFFNLQNEKDSN